MRMIEMKVKLIRKHETQIKRILEALEIRMMIFYRMFCKSQSKNNLDNKIKNDNKYSYFSNLMHHDHLFYFLSSSSGES